MLRPTADWTVGMIDEHGSQNGTLNVYWRATILGIVALIAAYGIGWAAVAVVNEGCPVVKLIVQLAVGNVIQPITGS